MPGNNFQIRLGKQAAETNHRGKRNSSWGTAENKDRVKRAPKSAPLLLLLLPLGLIGGGGGPDERTNP